MAIRIRKINGETVALCAAKYKYQKGDLYLNDTIHHALTKKFENDFKKEKLIESCPECGSINIFSVTLTHYKCRNCLTKYTN